MGTRRAAFSLVEQVFLVVFVALLVGGLLAGGAGTALSAWLRSLATSL